MKQVKYPPEIKEYKFGEELGSGAFSKVVKAVHIPTQKLFACKIFPKTNLEGKGDLDRFQREIDTMAYLRHKNVVALNDFFWDELNFYMILDYCPGGELFDYIVKNDKLNEPTAALIFQQVCSAVAYCHSMGVAHRDLKPENVLIDKFPTVKVSDFGLCGFIDPKDLMKTFCGSPCYCAPETLGRIEYDGTLSDVWSLGVILFAMVTGEHPWNITNVNAMIRQILRGSYSVPSFVSPLCKDLILKMMKVNVNERIRMEEVLTHQWLKIAAKAKVTILQNIVVTMPEVPAKPPITMSKIQQEVLLTSQEKEFGIVSPFVKTNTSLGVLPQLSIRSLSTEFLGDTGVKFVTTLDGKMKKVSPNLPSLPQARQRSSMNLIANKKKETEAEKD